MGRKRMKFKLKPKYWVCQCRNCEIVFNLPRAEHRPLSMEIGKAKCPYCGKVLVRSNRNIHPQIKTITREQAGLM